MRRYVASLVFAACAAVAAPLAGAPAVHDDTPAAREGSPAVAVQRVRMPLPGLREEAAMVLVGTALIAIAAAVRRAA